jgi:hypothetical protein
MIDSPVKKAILEELKSLSDAEQKQLLEFAKSLHKLPEPSHVGDVKDLFGSIAEDEALLMKKAVEEACESVNPRDW